MSQETRRRRIDKKSDEVRSRITLDPNGGLRFKLRSKDGLDCLRVESVEVRIVESFSGCKPGRKRKARKSGISDDERLVHRS